MQVQTHLEGLDLHPAWYPLPSLRSLNWCPGFLLPQATVHAECSVVLCRTRRTCPSFPDPWHLLVFDHDLPPPPAALLFPFSFPPPQLPPSTFELTLTPAPPGPPPIHPAVPTQLWLPPSQAKPSRNSSIAETAVNFMLQCLWRPQTSGPRLLSQDRPPTLFLLHDSEFLAPTPPLLGVA